MLFAGAVILGGAPAARAPPPAGWAASASRAAPPVSLVSRIAILIDARNVGVTDAMSRLPLSREPKTRVLDSRLLLPLVKHGEESGFGVSLLSCEVVELQVLH